MAWRRSLSDAKPALCPPLSASRAQAADTAFLSGLVKSVSSLLSARTDQSAAPAAPPPAPAAGPWPVEAICPLHGPGVRSSLTQLLSEYKTWTSAQVRQEGEATPPPAPYLLRWTPRCEAAPSLPPPAIHLPRQPNPTRPTLNPTRPAGGRLSPRLRGAHLRLRLRQHLRAGAGAGARRHQGGRRRRIDQLRVRFGRRGAALRYAAPACLSALAAVRRPCPGPGCPASLPGPTARSGRRARAILADRCWRWCAGRTAS